VRWRRSDDLPSEAKAALGLERRDRVLAAARLVDGTWAAATGTALVLPGERLDWVNVEHAEWADDTETLVVDLVHDTRRRTLRLDQPGRLPETVRERVTASIVASRRYPVQGRAGVRVVARRRTSDDDLLWQVVADAGLDPEDERVRAVADAGLAEMRRELDS
jgi:hypothetical protein